DTGQAPTPPETTPPDLTDSEDGGVTDEMRERRRMLAQRERDAAAAQEPAFQFDQPDSRPLSLPGVQSPSSYARLGGSRALRPYRTPNFTQQQQGSPLDIFEGPGGLRPLSDEELADQVGRQFIRRRG
nr:hypothetical protein [Acidobacteriota bacterium]